MVYATVTGAPYIDGGAEVQGSPSTAAIPEYDGSLEAVFGVSLAELKSMADLSTTFTGIRFPNPFMLASAPPTESESNIRRAYDDTKAKLANYPA